MSSSSLLIAPVSAPATPATTATGLGSGINISGMVSSLIAAESGAQTSSYTSETTKANADITALGTLKNALYSFQTSVQTLQNVSTFQANTATSSNTAAFTATADGTSVPNSYQVGVTQLAKAAQMSSSFYSNASALVGAGSLSLNLGTAYVNGATLSSSAPPLTSTDMGINGYPITAVTVLGNTPQQNVIASINASTGSTGVIAVDNGSGGISLSNSLSTNTASISITGNPETVLAETGLTTGTTKAVHQTFTVNTDATTTLSDLVAAINNASDNAGITASIIHVDAGVQLLLTSNTMGAANAIGVQATPLSGSNLSSLNTLTTVQAASNAIITLNGQQVTRQSNSFSDVLPGVTFSLTAPTTSTASLAIVANPATATTNVNSFITAYNGLMTVINNLTSFNSSTGTAAPLFGDPMMLGIKNQLLHAFNSSVQGIAGFGTLPEIGIGPDNKGILSLNSVVFSQALAANSTGVAKLFASTTGIAAVFNTVLNNQVGDAGTIATRVSADNTQLTNITNQQITFNARMSVLQAQYLKQFNVMDGVVANLQNTSNSLTGMLANLPGFNGVTNSPINTKIG